MTHQPLPDAPSGSPAPAEQGLGLGDEAPPAKASRWPRLPGRGRLLLLAGLGVLLALALYYPVGAWRASVIDDDPGFQPPPLPAVENGAPPAAGNGPSRAVAMAAALIRREIDVHGWTANKPFFMPAAILDDMPNFQKGIIAAIGWFALEMDQQAGHAPDAAGANGGDADLARAAGLLQYPPNVWMIDPRVPWAATISTEKQYRNAARAFEAYNQRLATGGAVLLRRADMLQAMLERFAKELDASAGALEPAVTGTAGLAAWHADEPYYAAKGRAYASLMLLKGLGEDFAPLLAERGLADGWQAMLGGLAQAATPRPWLVEAGGPTALLLPNHPAILGYHLLRAKSRLTALAAALQ